MPVLTLVDTRRIQQFVFTSNRLRDVIAGSWMVETYTAEETLSRHLVSDAEIIFAGGGNALIVFPNIDGAKEFSARYSHFIIEQTFELDVAVAHEEFSQGSFGDAFFNLQKKMRKNKLEKKPSAPMLGISVTASGRETGLPASSYDSDSDNLISQTVSTRRSIANRNDIDERWEEYIPFDWESKIEGGEDALPVIFPKDLDNLGRTRGEISKIGVIHVDGNSIGKRLNEMVKGWVNEGLPDSQLQEKLGEISTALDSILDISMSEIMEALVQSLSWSSEDETMILQANDADTQFKLQSDTDHVYLPIRPILSAGDDLTLVTDARIALSVAEIATKAYSGEKMSDFLGSGQISACAGVSIIHAHSPLFRGYQRSEELCKKAKSWRRKEEYPGGVLDWHIDQSNALKSISQVRAEQYGELIDADLETYKLTLKPYPLGDDYSEKGTWLWFSRSVLGSEGSGFRSETWNEHSSKIHELRNIVRDGKDAIRSTLNAWKGIDSDISLPKGIENGFWLGRTPLIDAIELLDVYYPLEGGMRE